MKTTLHAAIELVLSETGTPLTPNEVVKIIQARRLYDKRDGSPLSSHQVISRVRKYPTLFRIIDSGEIELLSIAIRPYQNLAKDLNEIFKRDKWRYDFFIQLLIFTIYKKHGKITTALYGKKSYLESLITNICGKYINDPAFEDDIVTIIEELNTNEAYKVFQAFDQFIFSAKTKPSHEEFGNFYNEIVNEFSWDDRKNSYQFSTPKGLSKFLAQLFKSLQVNNIFDPFAGRASVLVDFLNINKGNNIKITLGDIDKNSVVIGQLNLISNGINNFTYKRCDAFSSWKDKINADLIISCPPFGKIPVKEKKLQPWQTIISQNLIVNSIQLCLYHLSNKGKAVLVVPTGFLFGMNKAEKDLRTNLVDNGLIKGIIQLPRGIFQPYAAISSAIIILSKIPISSPAAEEIFICDASSLDIEDKAKTREVADMYLNELEIPNKSSFVSIDFIRKLDYNLQSGWLTFKTDFDELSQDEYVELGELTENISQGVRIEKEKKVGVQGFPIIEVSNLSRENAKGFIQKKDITRYIENFSPINYQSKILRSKCVLISSIGRHLKPTIFLGNFESLHSSEVISIRTKKDRLLPEYLFIQIRQKYFQDQVASFKKGITIERFTINDLRRVKIKLIPVADQQKNVSEFFSEKLIDLSDEQSEKSDREIYDLLSRLKHSIETPISGIGMDIESLSEFLLLKSNASENISMSDFLFEPINTHTNIDNNYLRLDSVLNRIKKQISDIQDTLRKTEVIMRIGQTSGPRENIRLKSFIFDSILTRYQGSNATIQIFGKDIEVFADKSLLKEIICLIIENALKHGFTNIRYTEKNIIRINIEKSDIDAEFVELEIANNGKELPESFNLASYTKRNISKDKALGGGYGLYLVKKLIENQGGYIIVDRDFNPHYKDFKVKFKLYLPLSS